MHDHASVIGVTVVRYRTSEQADIAVRLLAHQRAASLPDWPERSDVSTQ